MQCGTLSPKNVGNLQMSRRKHRLPDCADPEDVRAEYMAIATYFSYVVTFRFTIFGSYLVAFGIVSQNATLKLLVFLLILGFTLYQLERRTTELYHTLAKRSATIEEKCWGYSEEVNTFFSHRKGRKRSDKIGIEGEIKQYAQQVKQGKLLEVIPSHTLTLHSGYWLGLAFTLLQLLLKVIL
jgi:hypothetical protein